MNRLASNFLKAVYFTGLLYGTQLPANVHHTSELHHKENGIKLKLLTPPNENTLHVAPYNNAIVSVSLNIETETQALKLTTRKDHWEIELPRLKKAKGHTIFIETIGKPRLVGPLFWSNQPKMTL